MSTSSPLYSIVLPTYNETENLPLIVALIDRYLAEHGVRFEVVIVDDSSPDGTFATAQTLQRLYGEDKIVLLSRPSKSGLGSAYIDGLKLCKGSLVFLMDADLSHHPRHLIEFIRKQREQDADIVTGTRYALGGGIAGASLRVCLAVLFSFSTRVGPEANPHFQRR